jgi:hypothetical protein
MVEGRGDWQQQREGGRVKEIGFSECLLKTVLGPTLSSIVGDVLFRSIRIR